MTRRPALPPPPPWHAELDTLGVTGTNGKTSTTTFAAAALSALSAPVARVTTLGFFVGDERLELAGSYAAFVQTMATARARGGRRAAIELSSEALNLGFARAWPCRVGVFTNLTRDHLDRHGSAEHYLASKAQLFVHLPVEGAAVLNGCDASTELLDEVTPAVVRRIYYGLRTRAEPVRDLQLEATSVELSWSGTRLTLAAAPALGDVPESVAIRSIGDVFAENALAALAGAIAAGVPGRVAAACIADVPPIPGRFELIRRAPYVVVDYAHTPDAMQRTLRSARRLCAGKLAVVFGAGGERDRAKRPLMGEAARAADRVVLTSDNPRSEDPAEIAAAIREGLGGHLAVDVILDRAAAIRRAVRDAGPDDVVVIAGKGHEAEQHIGARSVPFSDRDVARSA